MNVSVQGLATAKARPNDDSNSTLRLLAEGTRSISLPLSKEPAPSNQDSNQDSFQDTTTVISSRMDATAATRSTTASETESISNSDENNSSSCRLPEKQEASDRVLFNQRLQAPLNEPSDNAPCQRQRNSSLEVARSLEGTLGEASISNFVDMQRRFSSLDFSDDGSDVNDSFASMLSSVGNSFYFASRNSFSEALLSPKTSFRNSPRKFKRSQSSERMPSLPLRRPDLLVTNSSSSNSTMGWSKLSASSGNLSAMRRPDLIASGDAALKRSLIQSSGNLTTLASSLPLGRVQSSDRIPNLPQRSRDLSSSRSTNLPNRQWKIGNARAPPRAIMSPVKSAMKSSGGSSISGASPVVSSPVMDQDDIQKMLLKSVTNATKGAAWKQDLLMNTSASDLQNRGQLPRAVAMSMPSRVSSDVLLHSKVTQPGTSTNAAISNPRGQSSHPFLSGSSGSLSLNMSVNSNMSSSSLGVSENSAAIAKPSSSTSNPFLQRMSAPNCSDSLSNSSNSLSRSGGLSASTANMLRANLLNSKKSATLPEHAGPRNFNSSRLASMNQHELDRAKEQHMRRLYGSTPDFNTKRLGYLDSTKECTVNSDLTTDSSSRYTTSTASPIAVRPKRRDLVSHGSTPNLASRLSRRSFAEGNNVMSNFNHKGTLQKDKAPTMPSSSPNLLKVASAGEAAPRSRRLSRTDSKLQSSLDLSTVINGKNAAWQAEDSQHSSMDLDEVFGGAPEKSTGGCSRGKIHPNVLSASTPNLQAPSSAKAPARRRLSRTDSKLHSSLDLSQALNPQNAVWPQHQPLRGLGRRNESNNSSMDFAEVFRSDQNQGRPFGGISVHQPGAASGPSLLNVPARRRLSRTDSKLHSSLDLTSVLSPQNAVWPQQELTEGDRSESANSSMELGCVFASSVGKSTPRKTTESFLEAQNRESFSASTPNLFRATSSAPTRRGMSRTDSKLHSSLDLTDALSPRNAAWTQQPGAKKTNFEQPMASLRSPTTELQKTQKLSAPRRRTIARTDSKLHSSLDLTSVLDRQKFLDGQSSDSSSMELNNAASGLQEKDQATKRSTPPRRSLARTDSKLNSSLDLTDMLAGMSASTPVLNFDSSEFVPSSRSAPRHGLSRTDSKLHSSMDLKNVFSSTPDLSVRAPRGASRPSPRSGDQNAAWYIPSQNKPNSFVPFSSTPHISARGSRRSSQRASPTGGDQNKGLASHNKSWVIAPVSSRPDLSALAPRRPQRSSPTAAGKNATWAMHSPNKLSSIETSSAQFSSTPDLSVRAPRIPQRSDPSAGRKNATWGMDSPKKPSNTEMSRRPRAPFSSSPDLSVRAPRIPQRSDPSAGRKNATWGMASPKKPSNTEMSRRPDPPSLTQAPRQPVRRGVDSVHPSAGDRMHRKVDLLTRPNSVAQDLANYSSMLQLPEIRPKIRSST